MSITLWKAAKVLAKNLYLAIHPQNIVQSYVLVINARADFIQYTPDKVFL